MISFYKKQLLGGKRTGSKCEYDLHVLCALGHEVCIRFGRLMEENERKFIRKRKIASILSSEVMPHSKTSKWNLI